MGYFSLLYAVVNGGYTQWSNWLSCSQTCGGGQQVRTRSCTSPSPANGGLTCLQQNLGTETDIQLCNTQACSGNWSSFLRRNICSISFPINFAKCWKFRSNNRKFVINNRVSASISKTYRPILFHYRPILNRANVWKCCLENVQNDLVSSDFSSQDITD